MEQSFQISLRKVVETFQNAAQEIENNFIPLFHSIVSPEDECKMEKMAQKVIAGNLKQVWKIIGGKNLTDILSSECEEISLLHRNENNCSSPSESASQENHGEGSIVNGDADLNIDAIFEAVQKINTENCPDLISSRTQEKGNEKNDIHCNIEGRVALAHHDDDDIEEIRGEAGNSQLSNGEGGVTNTGVAPVANSSKSDNSEFQDTLTSVYNDSENVVPPCDKNVSQKPETSTNMIAQDVAKDSSQKSSDDENAKSPKFQDTPTSVSEFRAYNNSKNTHCHSAKTPPWLEKCESYIKMLEAIPNLPDSQDSVMSCKSFGDTNDDNITSISLLNEVEKMVDVNKPSSINPELFIEDNNKENFPVNSFRVEAEHDRSKQPVETPVSDDSNDYIEIVKDMNPKLNQIPILLGVDDESETFHVGDTKDDQSINCVSTNILKTQAQPLHSNDVKENEKTNNVSSNELINNINLTGDTDINNLDKEIDILIGDSDIESLLRNHQIASTFNQSLSLTTETCTAVPDQSELAESKAKENTVLKPCGNIDSIDLTLSDNEVNAHSESIVIYEKSKYPNNDCDNSSRSQKNILRNIEPTENIPDENSIQTPRPDSTKSESNSSILKQESLHIVDNIVLTDSPETGISNSQVLEEIPNIISQGGNVNEDELKYDINGCEVIPSVKVEVVMNIENDSDMNENVCHESTAPNKATGKIKKLKSRKKLSAKITNATNTSPMSGKSSDESSNHIFKTTGPKSKTTQIQTLCKSSSDNLVRKLTNLSSLNKTKSSDKRGPKNKVKRNKRPKLSDYYDENENISELSTQSFVSSSQELNKAHDSVGFLKFIDTTAEEMAKSRILQSDDDDDESLFSMTNNKNRKSKKSSTTSLKKPNHTTSKKPIPSWRKARLLTASLDSPKLNFKRNKTKNVESDDDDVQSVCSQMQMKIRNSTLRDNLRKLLDHKDTVINDISKENQLIIISSSEEEDEDENTDNCVDDHDDIASILTESNNKDLISKFKTTAQIRERWVSILQKKAQKIITKTRVHDVSCSSQDITAFEDRYKDIPPLILYIDEETGDVVSASPFYSKILKDHQKRGLQFMWHTCFGSKKMISEDEGSGCILAHDMGLGKSVQVIALLHTLHSREDLPLKKILILSPKSLVQNWEDEITKWTIGLQVKLRVYSWQTDTDLAVQDLHEWSAQGGVYILGYQMFVSVCKKIVPVDFSAFFLNPGPDVVICDEAHLLKNTRSETHRCLSKIRTKRRIALTGTPIQNNLEELYNIVSLVQPKFMKKEKFREQFILPISCAQSSNATTYERNKAAQRISVLHKELEKVMDREEGNQEVGLPPKLHYDIFLNLEPLQKKLYKFFCEKMKLCFVQPMIFPAVRLAEIISIHPKSLETSKPVEELCKGKDWNEELRKGNDWHADLKGAWWKNVLTKNEIKQLEAKEAGVKIKVAYQIIENAIRKNEKVLVFCSARQILNLMESFLEESSYVKNINYFRLDGSVPITLRKKYLNIFNDEKNTNAHVFLLTHKVGGVGLNFVGANRIIILDMPWNPSHHEQSSNRTYRLGQKKTSYIYRLITKGTLEENIYQTTVSKQSLSKRVVDRKKIKSMLKAQDTFNFQYQDIRRSKKDLPLAKDELLNSIFQSSNEENIIHSYKEQGELFELSEEQLNEGQAYEEYLLESRTFDDLPGETKRKRKRKSKIPSVIDEAVPNNMMTKEHLENYDHSELLSRIGGFSEQNRNLYSYASSESSQQEPMNLSRSNDIYDAIPMPPPLIAIPRDKLKTKKPSKNINPCQNRSHSVDDETDLNQGKPTEIESLLKEAIPLNTNQLPTNSKGYNSITDFINSCVSAPPSADENTDAILEKLSKNKELAVLTRLRTIDKTSTIKPFSENKKVGPKKRLSINPDIFIQSPAEPSEQEQQQQNSQSQQTTNVTKESQNIQSHNHSEQLQYHTHILQNITQQSRKRALPHNQVSEKRRRTQSSITDSELSIRPIEINNANKVLKNTVSAQQNILMNVEAWNMTKPNPANVQEVSPPNSTLDLKLRSLTSANVQKQRLLNSNNVSQSNAENRSHKRLPNKISWKFKKFSPSQSQTLGHGSLSNEPGLTTVHKNTSGSVSQKPQVNDQQRRPVRNSSMNQTSQPGTSLRTNLPVVSLNNESFELTSDIVDEILDHLPANYDLNQWLVSCLQSMMSQTCQANEESHL